jgi:hypothetical protein
MILTLGLWTEMAPFINKFVRKHLEAPVAWTEIL